MENRTLLLFVVLSSLLLTGCIQQILGMLGWSVIGIDIVSFKFDCSGTNSCSPFQTTTVDIGAKPHGADMQIKKVEFVWEEHSELNKNCSFNDFEGDVDDGKIIEKACSYDFGKIKPGQYNVTAIVRGEVRENGTLVDGTSEVKTVVLNRPTIEVSLFKPEVLKNNDYQFVHITNKNPWKIDDLRLYLCLPPETILTEGASIRGARYTEQKFDGCDGMNQHPYISDEFEIEANAGEITAETKIKLAPNFQAPYDYKIGYKLVWVFDDEEVTLKEDKKGIYLSPG